MFLPKNQYVFPKQRFSTQKRVAFFCASIGFLKHRAAQEQSTVEGLGAEVRLKLGARWLGPVTRLRLEISHQVGKLSDKFPLIWAGKNRFGFRIIIYCIEVVF